MRINGVHNPLSFQMAKAYGVGAARPAPPINNLTPPLRNQPPDSFQPASSVQRLVAARVTQPVNFDGANAAAERAQPAPPVLQMYTRAADKIEAAVAVHIGRSIDIRG